MIQKSKLAVLLAIGMAAAVSGCAAASPSASPSPAGSASEGPWDDVVAAAVAEGEVTIYSTQTPTSLEELKGAFEAEYGITVNIVRATDSENIPRVETEQRTGSGIADVVTVVSEQWIDEQSDQGWFTPAVGPEITEGEYSTIADLNRYSDAYLLPGAFVAPLAWNAGLFEGTLESYEDLLDPALAGGRLGVTAASSWATVDFYMYLEEAYGDDFLADLAAQEPRVYDSVVPLTQAVIAGEVAAGSMVSPPGIVEAQSAGAPVEWTLVNPAWATRWFTVIPATSPHPNAAQLLVDFMASRKGQEVLTTHAASVLPDVEGAITDVTNVREPDLSVLDAESVAEFQARWDALFR